MSDIETIKKADKVFFVAHYFMDKSYKSKKPLSNKKLQKLLYYAQAWSLVLNGRKMFDGEFEAWVHGPAIPRVYRKYKAFGFDNINEKFEDSEFEKLHDDEKLVLEQVWRVYGKYTADYLEALTHSEKPWQDARAGVEPFDSSSEVISIASMKAYYGQRLTDTSA